MDNIKTFENFNNQDIFLSIKNNDQNRLFRHAAQLITEKKADFWRRFNTL